MSTCTQEKNDCVEWVGMFFKDCVCYSSIQVSFGLGIVSLFCWGIAEIPQIITNFQAKSGHGVSLPLLLSWVLGDALNLVGCILEPATLPTQLYTATLYTSTTVVLVIQTIYYDYWSKWRVNQSFDEPLENGSDEREPLDPTGDVSAKPISTSGARTDMYYTSARSMANSGSSPYSGASYLGTPKSQDEDDKKSQMFYRTTTNMIPPYIGYGIFMASIAGIPYQATAIVIHAQDSLQQPGPNHYGMVLGWIMAAIYMGCRFPQIYLNIKRGNVEGLNPLMFIFALVANVTYVGSIFERSMEWYMIKANAPWLLDAAVCMLLDLFIIFQFTCYKLRRILRRVNNNCYEGEENGYSAKILV